MRPLDKVIDVILDLVPDNFNNKQYLKHTLESIKESYYYSAPETLGFQWARAGEALQTYIGTPDGETWKREVQGIFNGQIDYSDYLVNT
jgi:hypothetical protein